MEDSNIDKVHFIKVDTEGSELSVLKGLQKSISKMMPILQLEINIKVLETAGVHISNIHKFLKINGYTNFKNFSNNDEYMPIDDMLKSKIKGSKDYIFF